MNLSKKSFLVVVPVITVFFLVAAAIVFHGQKKQVYKLEKSRLSLALAELGTLYNQYNSFSESYMYTILESASVKQYLSENKDRYRRAALVRSIEGVLRAFRTHESDFLSLTVARINSEPTIIEYVELSENPFSVIPETLKSRAKNVLIDRKYPKSEFVFDGAQPYLAYSTLLDPITLVHPLPSQIRGAVSITFALEPTFFLSELRRYEKEFSMELDVRNTLPKESDDGFELVHIRLDARNYLVSRLTPDHINQQLQPTVFRLLIVGATFVFLCVFVLYFLLNKTVTGPIHQLEIKVNNVKVGLGDKLVFDHKSDDEIGRLASAFSDLYSKLSMAYSESNRLLKTDHLTKITNLYEMNREFGRRIEKAKRSNETVVFLYLDLDNFKFVNDRYGHDAGDKVLVAFSGAVVDLLNHYSDRSDNFHNHWVFGRIAGDEFGIVISGSPSSAFIDELSSNILALFQGGFAFTGEKYPISASIGVVSFPKDGDSPSQLISSADTAMYQSKHLGKNRVSHYSSDIAHKLRRDREVEQELKNADFNNEFFLVFLPILHTETLDIYGFEALLRWESPQLGTVSPVEFVPIAEACGCFEVLDSWVINQAFASYHDLKDIIGHDFVLSVNLSSAQIRINRIQEEIIALSKIFEIANKNIQLEMTETTGAEFATGKESLLSAITDAGFKLAIDDFGTGYTSLQQLVEYPASTIKFDKSFLEATTSGNRRKILKPLVDLCHSQHMSVTVEGVETPEQFKYVRSIQVEHIQGFLFSPPVTIRQLRDSMDHIDLIRDDLLSF